MISIDKQCYYITAHHEYHYTGLILACVTRKVKIDPLNDSRYSAALVYISTLFLLGSLAIFFLIEDNNLYAAVWTTYVLAEVCAFLGLNFIPKVSWCCIQLYSYYIELIL